MNPAAVVLMCGLPASGKTTTAGRLHAFGGGTLIRSCDVFQALGISLPAWVERTRGFTVDVQEYDRLRDRAYVEMATLLEKSLASAAGLIVVDAVHGEPAKRRVAYEICHAHDVRPVLLLCRCADMGEVTRRFAARRGRETEPEHEASDLAVFHDIHRRWRDPSSDRSPDGTRPTVVTYDTLRGTLTVTPDAARVPIVQLIRAALVA